MARHSENALRLARTLEAHPAVSAVHYPGLASDPGHDLAVSLVGAESSCFGGMLSFTLSGDQTASAAFVDALQLCTIAVSLGDCSTLVWPWHGGNLIRVSVGIEDFADIEKDVKHALDQAAPAMAAD
jgi:cystathionine beta-lyase/cystathionine gamma-synthase